MSALEKSCIEHHEGKAFHDIAPECRQVLTLVGGEVSDEDKLGAGRFCIGKDLDTRIVVAGDIESGPFGIGCDGCALLSSLPSGGGAKCCFTLASISSISKSPTATTAIRSGPYQRS